MFSLGEKVIGVLKARGFDVTCVGENTAVSGGLLIDPHKQPRLICADTRVDTGDSGYTGNLKLIGGMHALAAVRHGGNEEGYRASARVLRTHGVIPAIHVDKAHDPRDCKMFKLWAHGHLSGVKELELTERQLGELLASMEVRTDCLEGHAPLDLIVNTVGASTINKGRAPRSLAVDQWVAVKLGIGDGHLDIFAQAGEYLFGGSAFVKVIVDSKLARR